MLKETFFPSQKKGYVPKTKKILNHDPTSNLFIKKKNQQKTIEA